MLNLFWDNEKKDKINGLSPKTILKHSLAMSNGERPETIPPSMVWNAFYPAEDKTYVPVDSNPYNFWIDNIYPMAREELKSFTPNLLIYDKKMKLNDGILTITQFNPYTKNITYNMNQMIIEPDDSFEVNTSTQIIIRAWQILARVWNQKGLLAIAWEQGDTLVRLTAENYASMVISEIRRKMDSPIYIPDTNIVKLHNK